MPPVVAPMPVIPPAQAAQSPPEAWRLLFPAIQYHPEDRRAVLIRELIYGFTRAPGWAQLQAGLQRYGDGKFSLDISFRALHELCPIDDVSAALELQPLEGLACISAAAHQVAFYVYPQHMGAVQQGAAANSSAGPVAVRLTDFTPSVMHIRQLNSSSIGKLSTLRGTVLRMSTVRPLVIGMDFVCGKCGDTQFCSFADGKFTPPESCSGGGCRSRTFAPARSTATFVDWRKVRLQEVLGADKSAVGSVPRCVEVELRDSLVDSCMVGDVITVLGHVKVLATGEDLGKSAGGGGGKPGGSRGGGGGSSGGPKQGLFLIYLDAVSVVNSRPSNRPVSTDLQAAESIVPGCEVAPGMPAFTTKDLEFVIKFSEDYEGDQLRQLVQSLCPSIFGHELVKAGLLLALFGGVRKNAEDEDQQQGSSSSSGLPEAGKGEGRVAIRGSIHVLVVGDPGLGKSQLLQAAAAASPRGLYVCGNTSSSAGLTVSVVRDAVTGDFVFEAGAVVLADRGVCCVDEFDKMTAEHQVLLEAMEQQSVSVAKGGMVASLPARTTILAAANPAEGHYNKAKSVCANLKMSPAMLSRFDLIFILLDKPDEALDQALSEHVMALHSGLTNRATAARQRLLEYRPGSSNSGNPSYSGAAPSSSNGAHNHNDISNSTMGGRQAPTSARASALHPRLSQQQQHASQQQQQPSQQQQSHGGQQQRRQDRSSQPSQASQGPGAENHRGGFGDPLMDESDNEIVDADGTGMGGGVQRPLRERLQLQPGEEHHPLPIMLLRKYIAYAKQYCSPVLSDGARDVLQSFYLQLRQQASPGSSNPITARQLESLVRLAEARARCELRQVVSEKDAHEVVEIMKEALYDRFMDDIACIDFRRGGGSSSSSAGRSGGKAAEAKRYLLRLQHMCENQGRDTVSTGELHALATEIGLNVRDVSDFLEQLNEAGELLQRGGGQYKVRCAPAPTHGPRQGSQQQSQGYTQSQTQNYSRNYAGAGI